MYDGLLQTVFLTHFFSFSPLLSFLLPLSLSYCCFFRLQYGKKYLVWIFFDLEQLKFSKKVSFGQNPWIKKDFVAK
jgi:hypothetical protein